MEIDAVEFARAVEEGAVEVPARFYLLVERQPIYADSARHATYRISVKAIDLSENRFSGRIAVMDGSPKAKTARGTSIPAVYSLSAAREGNAAHLYGYNPAVHYVVLSVFTSRVEAEEERDRFNLPHQPKRRR